MSATPPVPCPKCGYARKASDTAPAWQCPSCGVAYNKVGDAARNRPARNAAAEGDTRVRTLSVGQGDRAGSTALTVYGGVMLLFFPLLFAVRSPLVLPWLPTVIAVCAFAFWLAAYRRMRMVADVPTSTVAAAAQGYVELRGTVAQAPGDALVGHLTRTPCIWYRYSHMRGDQVESGERGARFILRDETGDCVIDTAQAEVVCDRCQEGVPGVSMAREWSLRVGDPVYAIGHFTSGGAAAARHVGLKAAYAHAAHQRDAQAYVARYDTDNDGTVEPHEAAAAREALRRDAEREYTEQGGVHALGPSPDGRPFLVIGANHERLVSRYRRLAMAHLLVFFLALACSVALWRM